MNRPVAGIDETVSLASESLFDRSDAGQKSACLKADLVKNFSMVQS